MWLTQLRGMGGEVGRGTQIVYVPSHADNLAHKDCEAGFVTSIGKGGVVFCRYWSKHEEGELRTKANSEGTRQENLFVTNSVSQDLVEEMLEKYC